MVFPKARLVVSAVLFVVWIGFLAFLVYRTRNPVILSRPQLEAASVVVLADVAEKDGRPAETVTVKKVFWPLTKDNAGLAGARLMVDGLADAGLEQGWDKPGEYILPLTKTSAGYQITPIPASPGYPRHPPNNTPNYVAIELQKLGPNKDKVQEIIDRLTGAAAGQRQATKGIFARNVPWQKAEDFKSQFKAAGAEVTLRDEETRIYKAVPDALEQLEEIKFK